MDFMARHGFDVYLLDLPGYGRSTRPVALDQPAEAGEPVETTAQAEADYAAVVDWVLKRRHLAKLDVMGWSWGTTIAGGFAADQPDKVNRLVLYASVWLSHQQSPTGADAKLGAYRLVTRDEALARWMNGVPDDKKADLIPPGWFDQWQQATWATDLPDCGYRPSRPLADVPSVVANRTNDPRRISSDKSIRGNVVGDYRPCRVDRILPYCYATDDGRAGCAPHAFLNHDGLSDCGSAALRRFKRMASRDDAHVRPDHHIVCDVEAAKVIESAVLIYEDIMPHPDFVPTGSIKWRDQ
jgi:pimeloyl-ACP methyl ester carboxylesterase